MIRRIAIVAALGLSLAGCTTFRTDVAKVYDTVTGATVSPAAVLVASNSFDALEATATNYLTLRRCGATVGPVCRDPKATRIIVSAVRAGRVARNNLEQFMIDHPGALGPSGLYDALSKSVSTLQAVFAQYQVGAGQ